MKCFLADHDFKTETITIDQKQTKSLYLKENLVVDTS